MSSYSCRAKSARILGLSSVEGIFLFLGQLAEPSSLFAAPRLGALSAGSSGNSQFWEKPARQHQIENDYCNNPNPIGHWLPGIILRAMVKGAPELLPFFHPHLFVDWRNWGFVLKAKLMDEQTSRNRANNFIAKYFGFERTGTTLGREILAGLTTFVTMSYIIVVNPAILKAAGIPVEPSMVATVVIAVFGTLLMGIYANRPFAIAPYMGENAFLAYTVVEALRFHWQQALAAVFLAGIAFFLLTLFRVRQWLFEAIPGSLRSSFAVGIGLFLTFIGLTETGIVMLGSAGAPLRAGHLTTGPALLAIFGFLLISVLMIRRFPAAILVGIVATALLAFATRIAPAPRVWVSMPPSMAPIFLQMDFHGALSWGFFPIVLTIFIMAFVDTREH